MESELPDIYADPDVLTQVFINLIRNAGKAVFQGETVDIKVHESDQNLHIDFSNPFHGSKVNDPETLFLPLEEGGRSIGLPLCYRLIKKMGGILSIAQEQKLTIITVSLPKTNRVEPWENPPVESCDTLYDLMDTSGLTALLALPELARDKDNGSGGSEKRRYARTEVKWPSTIRTTGKTLPGEIRNVSMDGAFIHCPSPPSPGETFWLATSMPKGLTLQVINEVIWQSKDITENDAGCQGMGVRFIAISNESRRFLEEVVPIQ